MSAPIGLNGHDQDLRFGVFGWPVGHSRSPMMQTAAFQHLGLKGWSYGLLPVSPDLAVQTMRALPEAGFAGANVTIPHKFAALEASDTISEAVKVIGAANTLIVMDDGGISAENTDVTGILSLISEQAKGESVQILGAGGSARAAVWAAIQAGASNVSIWNRTQSKAIEIASEFDCNDGFTGNSAVLINCTSVGLTSSGDVYDFLPIRRSDLKNCKLFFDLVYGQNQTQLVTDAAEQGAITLDGLDLLVAQGADSLRIWSGLEPPIDLMKAAAVAG